MNKLTKENNIIIFAKHEPPNQPWFMGKGKVIVNGEEIGYCDGETIVFNKNGFIENPTFNKKGPE